MLPATVLYEYCASVHPSTGAPPFLLMYGCNPTSTPFSKSPAFDALSYPTHLRAKIAELRDFVETNLAAAVHNQKQAYDQHTTTPSFTASDPVWLSIPTEWVIKSVKSLINMEIDKAPVRRNDVSAAPPVFV